MLLDTWLLYLIACIGLSLSPGPNGLLALTHGAMHGSRKTLFTIIGGATGFMLIIALCMFGIGALLKSSVVWLTALKWVGGAYLIWLGIQVWRSPPIAGELHVKASQASGWQLYRQGVLASITNPKVLLFFSAFLAQFIDPQRSLMLQFFLLAGTFVVIECVVEGLLANMANRIRHWLKRVGRGFNRTCGGIFIAIGAALPLRA
ncbi:MAG: LysE family transporter [Gammaproteobacteria bacterium]|uniref:LysE family translocator n=1 Tax=Vreelandella titanicae TaxID=664683 RepID=A0A558J8Q4_9GAMM|nr:LysE family transporter [Halomonas titanicae]MBR9905380.1 LysE family transporter [Gammaproteobacteria bacterium]TVU90006.1 LysE family translocator [Halomonas titanicae]